MTKLRIAIVAMVIAAGSFATFAFTNANNDVKTDQPSIHWYGNNGDGTYRQLSGAPDPDGCDTNNENPCTISSAQNLPGGFDYDNRPSDAVESSDLKVYVGS